jgi:hypothetical protein
MIPNHVANFGKSLLRLIRSLYGESDGGGDKSDAQCTCALGAPNNRRMDFLRMGSNARTGADSIRKDNN